MKGDIVQQQVTGDASNCDSVESISSWMNEDAVEMSQTVSVDDTLTPTEEDNDGSELQDDMYAESVDTTAAQNTIRGPNKQRINADYIQNKRKRINHLPAVTLTAVRSTGNPNHHNTRVLLQ